MADDNSKLDYDPARHRAGPPRQFTEEGRKENPNPPLVPVENGPLKSVPTKEGSDG